MVVGPVAVPLEVLYEADFVEWTEEMARLIEHRRTGEFDWNHLAEEIRDLGISQKSALRSHMAVLLKHLIKWEIQPERQGRSWEDSISNARTQIEILIEDIPSLNRYLSETFEDTYRRAARQAIQETRLPSNTLFSRWSREQVLDSGFLPE